MQRTPSLPSLLLLTLLSQSLALNHLPLGTAASVSAAASLGCEQQTTGSTTTRLAQPVGRPIGAAPLGWSAPRKARRTNGVRCGLLSGLKVDADADADAKLTVGQQVRVSATGLNFMNVPGNKQGFDPNGLLGTVRHIYADPKLSANREIKVEFAEPKKWIGHFEARELKPEAS
mmetsp:Transcript_39001/g.102781  ORF Transcript_39001/g.102781 Transcript_39001/m.102781 type:complete len:174 (+) Transcript_39001:86-607(+)